MFNSVAILVADRCAMRDMECTVVRLLNDQVCLDLNAEGHQGFQSVCKRLEAPSHLW